jgi:outer membrane protein OmpA-like peptidoglycan-associated protein
MVNLPASGADFRAHSNFLQEFHMICSRTTVLFAALAVSSLAQAAETPTTPAAPATPQSAAEQTLNPAAYPALMGNPAAFAQWSAAMANPATSMAMMQQAMEPNTYARMMSEMMNPAALQNYMRFVDPALYTRWMQAAMNPNFYAAMMAPAMNPANYLNWMSLPVNPQMWGQGMQMLNPALYMRWLGAPLNPAMLNAMMTPMNPGTYTNWMGAAMNPRTYGPWGGFMTMPTAPGAVPFNPAELMQKPSESSVKAEQASSKAAKAPGKPTKSVTAPHVAQAKAHMPTSSPKAQVPAETTTKKSVLSADTLFGINKSGIRDLSKEGRTELDAIAKKIKAMGEVEQVRIIGHADITGNSEHNRKLSEARARSVRTYLVAKGVKPGVIVTSGMGSSQPVVQCDMSLSKAELAKCLAPNRRVEIDVIGKGK